MFSFLLGLALRFALPTITTLLLKYGHAVAVELLTSKTPAEIVKEVKAIQEYPLGKNGQADGQ